MVFVVGVFLVTVDTVVACVLPGFGRNCDKLRVLASYIDNKKIGTAFEDLGLPNAFYFFAVADEPNHEGSGLNGNVPGIIKWDDSNYDPNSYEEQTIYGTVDRAEFEKYYIVPEGADLRGVVKVTLQADPVETEITQPPVFRWKKGDFTLT